jgi:hypothetical protein
VRPASNRAPRPFIQPAGWAVALWLAVVNLPSAALAQDPLLERRSKVEAAFLRNFARYVTWPANAFDNDRAPWVVCVVGDDRFDDALEATFRGRTEQGRPFEVLRAAALDDLPACQILFIGVENAARRRAILGRLKNKPVLTVSNAPDFLSEGGVIRLLPGEHIEMGVNLDQARSASLVIPTKLLEVSSDVVENGALRRRR